MRRSSVLLSALLALATACIGATERDRSDGPGPGGKADRGDDGGKTCAADGACDPSCELPDVDCFETFATHEDAVAFFESVEATLAPAEGRPPRAVVPESDARYAMLRGAIAEGWSAYARTKPVGD